MMEEMYAVVRSLPFLSYWLLPFQLRSKVFEMKDELFIQEEKLSGFVYMWVLPGRSIDRLLTISTIDQPFIAER
jgi:hypothetical protein